MRIVVIGAGFGAAVHAPNIRDRSDLELAGICDDGSGRASSVVMRDESAYHNWRAALAALDAANAVIVATPPCTHNEIVSEALARRLHVLVEKPAGLSAQGARVLANVARERGVVAAVNFQFRFEPLLERMRAELHAGRIGQLRSIEVQWQTGGRASSDQRAEWRHFVAGGGGILLSHFTHVVDLVRWLGGGAVTSISGDVGTWIGSRRGADGAAVRVDAEDHAVCHFSTATGVIGTISVSNVQPGGNGLRVTALAANGVVEFTHMPPFRPCDQRIVVRSGDGSAQEMRAEGMEGDTRSAAAGKVLDLFVRAVRGDVSMDLPTLDHAAAALQVMEPLRPMQLRNDECRSEGLLK